MELTRQNESTKKIFLSTHLFTSQTLRLRLWRLTGISGPAGPFLQPAGDLTEETVHLWLEWPFLSNFHGDRSVEIIQEKLF